MAIRGTTEVELADFWRPYLQIEQENGRRADYVRAARFWESYTATLRDSHSRIRQIRTDMEINTGWDSASSTAFYERINAGEASILHWLNGGPGLLDGTTDGADVGPGAVGVQFRELVDMLPRKFEAVQAHLNTLTTQRKVTGTNVAGQHVTAPITPGDKGKILVPDDNVGPIRDVITDAMRLRAELRDQFEMVRMALDVLPHNEQWRGPTAQAGDVPPGGNPGSAGPGSAAAGPANAAGPGGPGAPPGAGLGAATPPSTSEPGAEPPGAAPPGAVPPGGEESGGPASAVDSAPSVMGPAAGPSVPEIPPTDPELAGAPIATATPSTTPTATPLPGSIPGTLSTPTGGNPGFTPTGLPPPVGPTATPFPRGDGAEPLPSGPRSSTVDGPRGGGIPGGPVAGESPVPRGGPAGSRSGSGGGLGFYPPIMPPMYPPGGRGGGGIRPGEADFAGGPVRQAGGRDSWRAGLRPQLLGRTGDRDDEPDHLPPAPPVAGDEVLDEELWQVPGAAPVAPPEPPPRRGRSWGPG